MNDDEQQRLERQADRELIYRLKKLEMRSTLWRIVLCGAFLILAIKVSEPIARIFAGKDTSIMVSVSIAYTVSATLAGGAGWRYGFRQKQRADGLEKRVRELERSQPDPSNTDDNA